MSEEERGPKTAAVNAVGKYFENTSPLRMIAHVLFIASISMVSLAVYLGYKIIQKDDVLVSIIANFRDDHSDHFDKYLTSNNIARDFLTELRDRLGATDAVLFLLHNGKISTGGIPFFKATQFSQASTSASNEFIDVETREFPFLNNALNGQTTEFRLGDQLIAARANSKDLIIFQGPLFKGLLGVPHGWIWVKFPGDRKFTEAERAEIIKQVETYSLLIQTALILRKTNAKEFNGRSP